MQIRTRSAGRCRPSVVSTPLDSAARAENPGHPGAEQNPGTPAPVRVGEEFGDRRRYDAAHRLLRHLDDVNGRTPRDRHRGKFEADEPGADDDDVSYLVKSLAQDIGVGERAQRQHAVELGSRHSERPAARAGGQDQMVPGQLAARGQSQPAFGPVDRGHGLAGQDLDLMLGVEGLRPEPELVEAAVAGEVGFRKRRALIGRNRLVADHYDPAGKALLAQ